jgi:hypothetical protein
MILRACNFSSGFRYVAALGFIVLLGGCKSEPNNADGAEPEKLMATLRDSRPSPGFDTTGSDCAGRLYRDSAHAVSGTSECKNGATVFFSGHSDVPLAADLSCDYALFYTDRAKGTGRIACTDGSTGTFDFEETDATHGRAKVRMQDGREIALTYTQTVR